jgi:hypothetical protein
MGLLTEHHRLIFGLRIKYAVTTSQSGG